jgi:fermentation-respiration switch protein FrsA (DUF1100 family)
VGLLEDVPLLLVHGNRDSLVRPKDVRRLLAAAPEATRHLVVPGGGHGESHAADPALFESAVTGFLRQAFLAARD